MADLFLICHKVRGEAAFDIAIKLDMLDEDGEEMWIIPTSGHRAYPYWSASLDGLGQYSDIGFWPDPVVDEMPIDLPDHYPVHASPKEPKRNLLAELGLSKPVGHPAIVGKLNRRI